MKKMAKNCVMNVLKNVENIPGIKDGRHRIEICGGYSKNWWDHAWDEVHNVEITATWIKLYV